MYGKLEISYKHKNYHYIFLVLFHQNKTIKYRFTRGCYARRKVTTNLQFHVLGRSGGRNLHKKRLPNRKSFLKYAWRLCRVKRLSIVFREGATHVGKLRLIYDFHVFGRSGGRTLHKKKTPKQEVFLKIRGETLPSKTIKYRFTRGKNPRRSGGRTLHKKRLPNRKSF